MKKYFPIFVSLLLIMACVPKKSQDDILSQIPNKNNIESSMTTTLLPDSCEIGKPSAMIALGNYVVIAQDRSDYMLTILDLNT